MARKLLLSIAILWLITGCGLLPLFPDDGDGSPDHGNGAPDPGNGGHGPPHAALWETAAHFAPVLDLSWSPDGARVAVFAQHDPLTIVRAADGSAFDWRATSTWHPPHCVFNGGISWSPDGHWVALSGAVLDTATWSLGASLALDEGHMSDAIAFSPDGTRIAGSSRPRSGGQAGCVCLIVWDPATGEQLLALDAPGHDGYRAYISGVAWSPDGGRVLASTWWGPTWVYDLERRATALELPGAAAATWSPDGTRIVLAHNHDPWAGVEPTGIVSLLDATSGEVLAERTVLDAPIRAVAWHPAGHRIAVGTTDGTAALLAAETLAVEERLEVLGPVSVVRFAPDGASLAAGTGAGVVYLLPASLAAAGTRTPIGRGEVVATAWSPDGQYVASGGTDGVVAVRRASDGAVVAELAAPARVQALAWRPDGERLAVAAADVTLYDTTTWARVGSVAGDAGIGRPRAVAFGPDGASLVVMTHWDVHLVDVATMQPTWRFDTWDAAGESWMLERFSWAPAGTELVLAAAGGELWIVDPRAEDDPGYRRVPTALTEVQAMAHSADGSQLVVTGPVAAGDERRVLVLDAATQEVRHDVPFASGGGRNVAAGFTKDDDWFWAAGAAPPCGCPATLPGEGDVIKAWGVADGERVFGLANPRWLGAAAFSPDATRVVAGTLAGGLSLWAVP